MEQRVRVVKDLPEIELAGRKLGPLKEGEETCVRPWEASVLERHGVVEPVEEFTVVGLRKRILAEERSSRLNDFPEDFYISLSKRLENFRREGRWEEVEDMVGAFNALLDIRIRKLALLAISSLEVEDLPPEERFLVNRLSTVIKTWRRDLDLLLNGSPKGEVD